MARVTRVKKPFLSKLGEALKGAGQIAGTATTFIDIKTKLKNAQTQAAFAKNQAELLQIKKEKQQEQVRLANELRLNRLTTKGIRSKDNKQFRKMHEASVTKLLQNLGSTTTADEFFNSVEVKSEEFGSTASELDSAVSFIVTATPGNITSKQLNGNVTRGLNAFKTLMDIFPESMQKDLMSQRDAFVDRAEKLRGELSKTAEAAKERAAKRKLAQIKAPTKGVKEPKASQFKAGGFAVRAEEAEQVFKKLEESGFNRAQVGLEAVLPDPAKSQQLRQQDQAERNFVNAVLRRESGAAINPSEFESAEKQYFPRFGDLAEVQAQKAANRQIVIQALQAEAGPEVIKRIRAEAANAIEVVKNFSKLDDKALFQAAQKAANSGNESLLNAIKQEAQRRKTKQQSK